MKATPLLLTDVQKDPSNHISYMTLNMKPKDIKRCGFRLSMLVIMNHNRSHNFIIPAMPKLVKDLVTNLESGTLKYTINTIASIQ